MNRQTRPLADRFWDKVAVRPADECWEWQGATSSHGYGKLYINSRSDGGPRKIGGAHRVSYEMHFGTIPTGLDICHRCDNPPCVNPAHLFAGTEQDNIRDCISKGRFPFTKPKTHCKRGHEFTPDNVRMQHGKRVCRECLNASKRRSYHRAKERAS